MRVFVLTTGRSGSVTTCMAFSHATNFTSGHETRHHLQGAARLDYPDDHIECDPRLVWFTGLLHEHDPNARYVHLVRDREAVARSWRRRLTVHPPEPGHPSTLAGRLLRRARTKHPGPKMIHAFAYGLVSRGEPWSDDELLDVCRFYVDTVNANIRTFLRDRDHRTLALESAAEEFPSIWEWVGAEGDLEAAVAEFDLHHNRSTADTDTSS